MVQNDEAVRRSNQLNPNNREYWRSRGFNDRPTDWRKRAKAQQPQPNRQAKTNNRKK